uniref:Uncharacterized protein n=1 Tax=Bos mutus grunniens TaxID=30521 RepID=A0A8B9X3B3_BOSMU
MTLHPHQPDPALDPGGRGGTGLRTPAATPEPELRHGRRGPARPREVTSVRPPASSVKLGLKMEQYLSAIQPVLSAPRDQSPSIVKTHPTLSSLWLPWMLPASATSSRKIWWAKAEKAQPPAARTRRHRGSWQLAGSPSGGRSQRPCWVLRRSLCWRTELSQERGQFQTKPATWRRDQCLRKPPSSRRPQFLRCSWPQAGPWPQCGPRDWEHSASAECLSSPGGQHGTGPEKEPKSSGGPLSQPGGLLPITLQMSPQRDSSEAALTLSTSVRPPASSVKLGSKLEQYLSAIQRSESVKCANPSHTEFLVAPVDVTSKCHLFEKELVGQSREGPASSRKEDLQLSGVEKSQLNLWISRTQESAQQGPQVPRVPLWLHLPAGLS